MSQTLPSGFQDRTFPPRVFVRSRQGIARGWVVPPRKPSIKDSLLTGGYLVAYSAAYLAAGRAGIALVEWAWVAIFR
jgi:hypothetical protein